MKDTFTSSSTASTAIENLVPPKNHMICVRYIKDEQLTHVVTCQQNNNGMYYLFEVKDGKLVKTNHSSANPLSLEKWI